ncbi:MAG: hypothetical protein JXB36_10460 [Gammaproteobacteria bacterium]|nr:hypothetical protein [Gammaproteobacteria bacterium]
MRTFTSLEQSASVIVYSATRGQFTEDVFSNVIESRILAAFECRLGQSTSKREIESWKNSMQYMNNVLVGNSIPEDAGVAIEYRIPLTSKRVDFILTGRDAEGNDNAVVVELKQWSEVDATDKDAVVVTVINGAKRETLHPSYQAWTYAALIRDFNETVQEHAIQLYPCAYLHNCTSDAVVNADRYAAHTQRAPAFAAAGCGRSAAIRLRKRSCYMARTFEREERARQSPALTSSAPRGASANRRGA